MNAQILNNNVVAALLVGGLCVFGGPGLTFSAPCTSEVDGAPGYRADLGCGSAHVLDSGTQDFGLRENNTAIDSYAWELKQWGAGSGICEKESQSAPPMGSSPNRFDENKNCDGITNGWWFSDFDYTAGGPLQTADPVWYYKE